MIPSIDLTEFKKAIPKLSAAKISESKSFAVKNKNKVVAIVIIPRTDYVNLSADFLGEMSNSVGGKDINEVFKKEDKEDDAK
jgi:hypothetical protein